MRKPLSLRLSELRHFSDFKFFMSDLRNEFPLPILTIVGGVDIGGVGEGIVVRGQGKILWRDLGLVSKNKLPLKNVLMPLVQLQIELCCFSSLFNLVFLRRFFIE